MRQRVTIQRDVRWVVTPLGHVIPSILSVHDDVIISHHP